MKVTIELKVLNWSNFLQDSVDHRSVHSSVIGLKGCEMLPRFVMSGLGHFV